MGNCAKTKKKRYTDKETSSERDSEIEKYRERVERKGEKYNLVGTYAKF